MQGKQLSRDLCLNFSPKAIVTDTEGSARPTSGNSSAVEDLVGRGWRLLS